MNNFSVNILNLYVLRVQFKQHRSRIGCIPMSFFVKQKIAAVQGRFSWRGTF